MLHSMFHSTSCSNQISPPLPVPNPTNVGRRGFQPFDAASCLSILRMVSSVVAEATLRDLLTRAIPIIVALGQASITWRACTRSNPVRNRSLRRVDQSQQGRCACLNQSGASNRSQSPQAAGSAKRNRGNNEKILFVRPNANVRNCNSKIAEHDGRKKTAL